ncbi:MAG: DUF5011 domain-containing protein, partial [Actinomycetia bacterium]|nr:DUF5011 domain-containing protein [Actinomycetes bacterium]
YGLFKRTTALAIALTLLALHLLVLTHTGAQANTQITYQDNFTTISDAGSTGDADWSNSPWTEIGENDGPDAGNVRVVGENLSCSDGDCLRINAAGAGELGIERKVDLGDTRSSRLVIGYVTTDPEGEDGATPPESDDAAEESTFKVLATPDGGATWVILKTLEPAPEGAVADIDISPFAGASTAIRVTGTGAADDQGNILLIDHVTITADTSNTAPRARKDKATVVAGDTVAIDVITNDTDRDGDELTITEVDAPENGTAAITDGNTITYQPVDGFAGEDTFTYVITDAFGASDKGRVTITVNQPAPVMTATQWRNSLPPESPNSPLTFEPNTGQADPTLDYIARGKGYVVTLKGGDAVVSLGNGNAPHNVRMSFAGGASDPHGHGIEPIDDVADNAQHTTVQYDDIYPDIDVIYTADGRELEYSFTVNPGADPHTITIQFTGANTLEIDEDGTLVVDSRAGRDLIATAPFTYQEDRGTQVAIDSDYALNDDGTIGFTVAAYDPTLPLIIDPTFKSVDSGGGFIPDGGTLDLPVPAGVVAGDLLIAQVGYNAVAGSTITPPAGWNTIDVLSHTTKGMMQGLYWREATGSEPAQYSFTLSSGKSDTAAGTIAAYSDVNLTSPIDAFGGQENGTSTSVVAPSITTTQAGTTLVGFFAVRDDGSITPPAGMTERWDVNSNAGVGAVGETTAEGADELLGAAGPTGTRTATAQASDGSIGHLVALAPITADPGIFYLKSEAVPQASLSSTAPVATVLANYDPARDSFPGIVIQKDGGGLGQTDPTKHQQWVAAAGSVSLDGPASLDLWAAAKDFDNGKRGVIDAGVFDCASDGSDCNLIQSARVDLDPLSPSGDWTYVSFDFGSVTYAVPPTRSLAVKVVADATSDDSMWFAYDTTVYPSRLHLTLDITPPVITLVGANPQTIEVGSPYVELGATALDNNDGDITGSIVIDATAVNTTIVGSYVVTYDVTDSSGNPATHVTRTVTVVDTTAPVITLVGGDPQTIEVG